MYIYIYIAKKLHRSIWLNLSIYIIYNIYIYILHMLGLTSHLAFKPHMHEL